MKEETKERIPRFLKDIFRSIVILFRLPLSGFRALPHFIIIGVQKGGTSTLFELLKQHPDIQTSCFKEVHYYDFNYSKGIHWYKSFFPVNKKNSKVIYGEASPYYIFHPLAPERLYKDNPNVKLIVMLRNPVHRAYSHYQMEKRKGREKLSSFEEAIQIEEQRTMQGYKTISSKKKSYNYAHQIYTYLARGRYNEQIELWLKYFSREQLLILTSEDFFSNPVKSLERVYQFLGVPCVFPKDLTAKNQGQYLPVSKETIAHLRAYYKPYNESLSALLGEEFNWS